MADPAYIVDGVLTDGEAWVALNANVLTVDTTTVTWTSADDGSSKDWSQFMDLVVIVYTKRDDTNAGVPSITFNNDTGTNYSVQEFSGDGSSVTATSGNYAYVRMGLVAGSATDSGMFGCLVAHFFDINSGKYKSGISQYATDTDGSGNVGMNAHVWKNQAAISEIDIKLAWGDMKAGTRLDLFGILPRMVA